jgi:hypothetical protein
VLIERPSKNTPTRCPPARPDNPAARQQPSPVPGLRIVTQDRAMLMERIMDRRLIVPLIVLAASASLATIGCREQSAPPPPGGPNTGGGTMPSGEPVPIDAAGAPVIRINGEISDEDARALAIAALATAQRTALNDGTDSTSLLQLVGWRPAGRHDSGRQSIALTYIVIHPIGVEPLWSPDFQLLSTLEPLERWAMQNLVAVGRDAKG